MEDTTLVIHPLYITELVLSLGALLLGWLCFVRKTPGWMQVPIIFPWLCLKIAYTAALFVGLVDPNVYAVYMLLIAGPASIMVLFAVRLWKHG